MTPGRPRNRRALLPAAGAGVSLLAPFRGRFGLLRLSAQLFGTGAVQYPIQLLDLHPQPLNFLRVLPGFLFGTSQRRAQVRLSLFKVTDAGFQRGQAGDECVKIHGPILSCGHAVFTTLSVS